MVAFRAEPSRREPLPRPALIVADEPAAPGTAGRVSPRWPWIFFAGAFLLITTHVLLSCLVRGEPDDLSNDHWRHWEFGRRFLVGESLYQDRCCFNYMPIAAMYWAPMALVSVTASKLISYAISVAGLALTLWLLARMIGPHCRGQAWKLASVAALAVLLCLRYLLRDWGDDGAHIQFLAILVGGIYLAWSGRTKASAACFGLAIATKISPVLFIPFMLWKRRWRLACYTAVAAVLWSLLPIAWMGPQRWWQDQRTWLILGLNVVREGHDEQLEMNNLRPQNQSLKMGILRYLVTYPVGHPMRLTDPADVPIFDLSQSTANRVAWGLMLGLVAVCVWQSQRTAAAPDDRLAWVVESSGMLILILLLSPVVWLHHLVFMLPAMFCLLAHDRCVEKLDRPAALLLGIYILLSLVFCRELLGKSGTLLLLSYRVYTVCTLIVLGLMLWVRPLHSRLNRQTRADAA